MKIGRFFFVWVYVKFACNGIGDLIDYIRKNKMAASIGLLEIKFSYLVCYNFFYLISYFDRVCGRFGACFSELLAFDIAAPFK